MLVEILCHPSETGGADGGETAVVDGSPGVVGISQDGREVAPVVADDASEGA